MPAKNPARKQNKVVKKKTPKVVAARSSSVVEAYGNSWSGTSETVAQDISAIEQALGVIIPSNLRKFLLSCAGRQPTKNFFDNPESEVFELGMGTVLPLRDHARQKGLAATCLLLRTAQALPRELIPFARDTGNANVICLRLPAQDIVYWLHDDKDEPIRRVAKSLGEFLSGLGECPF